MLLGCVLLWRWVWLRGKLGRMLLLRRRMMLLWMLLNVLIVICLMMLLHAIEIWLNRGLRMLLTELNNNLTTLRLLMINCLLIHRLLVVGLRLRLSIVRCWLLYIMLNIGYGLLV